MVIHQVIRPLAFSTTAPLAANGVYTSPPIDGSNYSYISIIGLSDQAGGYIFQYSFDGINWSSSPNNATTASTGFQNIVRIYSQWVRVVYTNGATLQGSFMLSAHLNPL